MIFFIELVRFVHLGFSDCVCVCLGDPFFLPLLDELVALFAVGFESCKR